VIILRQRFDQITGFFISFKAFYYGFDVYYSHKAILQKSHIQPTFMTMSLQQPQQEEEEKSLC